jgi:undecaprenyl-diphosphatase
MIGSVILLFFASFYIWALYAGLVVLWFIDGKIKKEQVIHALLAGVTAWIFTLVIKYFFPTNRPFMIDGRIADVLLKPMDGSFPSEHTALAFALAVTVFLHDRKVGWFYLISALIVGTARVLANVHYPIDIVGGALIGTLIAIIFEREHAFNLFVSSKRKRRR